MNKKSLLEYYKEVLTKVSFDTVLYEKEYSKAVRTLTDMDRFLLDQWLCQHVICMRDSQT